MKPSAVIFRLKHLCKIIFIIFLLSFSSSFGQSGKSGFNFTMPSGFSVLDTVSADFNADTYADYILILRNDSEKDYPDTARPLLILFGDKEGRLNQVARNDSVVLCLGCGGMMGDPYQEILIKENSFSITHYGGSAWRWTRNITFKYVKSKNNFVLQRDDGVSYHATDPDNMEDHLYHKDDFDKLLFEEYSYHK